MLKCPRSRPGFDIAQTVNDASRPQPAPGRAIAALTPSLDGAPAEMVALGKFFFGYISGVGHIALCVAVARTEQQSIAIEAIDLV